MNEEVIMRLIVIIFGVIIIIGGLFLTAFIRVKWGERKREKEEKRREQLAREEVLADAKRVVALLQRGELKYYHEVGNLTRRLSRYNLTWEDADSSDDEIIGFEPDYQLDRAEAMMQLLPQLTRPADIRGKYEEIKECVRLASTEPDGWEDFPVVVERALRAAEQHQLNNAVAAWRKTNNEQLAGIFAQMETLGLSVDHLSLTESERKYYEAMQPVKKFTVA